VLIGVPGVLNRAIIFVITSYLTIGISLVIFGARRSLLKHQSASIFPDNRAGYTTCAIFIGRYFMIAPATSVEVFTQVAGTLLHFEGIVRLSKGECPRSWQKCPPGIFPANEEHRYTLPVHA
jgi:hypothetical protein